MDKELSFSIELGRVQVHGTGPLATLYRNLYSGRPHLKELYNTVENIREAVKKDPSPQNIETAKAAAAVLTVYHWRNLAKELLDEINGIKIKPSVKTCKKLGMLIRKFFSRG